MKKKKLIGLQLAIIKSINKYSGNKGRCQGCLAVLFASHSDDCPIVLAKESIKLIND